MTKITISLPDDRLQKLKEIAMRLNIAPEELVRISIEELLTRPEEEFRRVLEYVLNKNAELYRRLNETKKILWFRIYQKYLIFVEFRGIVHLKTTEIIWFHLA